MKPYKLIDIATQVRAVIKAAEHDGLSVDDGNVIDLLADNITEHVSLSDLRSALVVAGYSARFPRATRGNEGRLASLRGFAITQKQVWKP
jgi:hypothetical protein